jgi:three-Cys-motif partner protein
MPPKIASSQQWVAKHLTPLMEQGKRLREQDVALPVKDLPTYDKGYWTGLKLIALKYYIKPYLAILGPRAKVAYIDLFAGPGVNLLGKRRVPVPGSPLIPLVIQEAKGQAFSHVFYCEKDVAFHAALVRRVDANLPNGWGHTVERTDANDFVSELPGRLSDERIGHSLVFIDPEGLEWKWDSMEYLLENVECDIIINFPSSGLQRNTTNTDDATRRTIAEFMGVPLAELPLPYTGAWAIKKYRENLAAIGKDVSTEIEIRSDQAYHYHLIPAVRTTYRGSPWFRALVDLRKRINPLQAEMINLVAQQVDGTLGVLDV